MYVVRRLEIYRLQSGGMAPVIQVLRSFFLAAGKSTLFKISR